ncbi:hypothetical protein HDU76_005363 [Blyttiomyces sp. JEL0837]|nr:hypothetical protein HDU76_005363 [Blyttiomyces sp. JEL0837]
MTTQRAAVYTLAEVDIINDVITKYKIDPLSFDDMSIASLHEALPYESTSGIIEHENWSKYSQHYMKPMNQNTEKFGAMERELRTLLLMQGVCEDDIVTSKPQMTYMDSQGTIIEIETPEAAMELDIPPTPTISSASSISNQDDLVNDIHDSDETLTWKRELKQRLLDDAEKTRGWIRRMRSPSFYSDLDVIQRIINESTEVSTSYNVDTISNSIDSLTPEGIAPTTTTTASEHVSITVTTTTTIEFSKSIPEPTSTKRCRALWSFGVC